MWIIFYRIYVVTTEDTLISNIEVGICASILYERKIQPDFKLLYIPASFSTLGSV